MSRESVKSSSQTGLLKAGNGHRLGYNSVSGHSSNADFVTALSNTLDTSDDQPPTSGHSAV